MVRVRVRVRFRVRVRYMGNYEFEPPVSEPPQTLSAYICVPVGPTEMKVVPSINEETGRRFLVVSSP